MAELSSVFEREHSTLAEISEEIHEEEQKRQPIGTYSLPIDLEWNLMRKMLQKAHELPEVKELLNKLGANHLDVRKHAAKATLH